MEVCAINLSDGCALIHINEMIEFWALFEFLWI